MSDEPCPHCHAPVPEGAPSAPFCCAGCRVAWDLLHDEGLTRYYEFSCGVANPGFEDPGALTWLTPLVARARKVSAADGQLTVTVDIQGIHCAGCVWLIQALFDKKDGAVHADINPGVGRVALTFDEAAFDIEAFLHELAQLGYRSGPPLKKSKSESAGLLMRLGVTTMLAMNVMLLSLAGYFGLTRESDPGIHEVFGWLGFVLSTVVVLVGGPVFFRGAWGALRRGALHLDVPIALGIGLAWGGNTWLFFTAGSDAAYFDTLAIFVALMLAGRYLQQRFIERNRRLLLDDAGLAGVLVRVLDPDGSLRLAPVDEILCGTTLLVTPGELVPVDAHVIGGPAELSLAWINGESDPVTFTADEDIPAGAHLLGGAARRVVAGQPFAESALHALLAPPARVTEAGDGFWHRVSTIYVVAVLSFAAIALVGWWPVGAERALEVAIAVLVITCPCAIGLATPLAYEIAHARMRRGGLFVRNADFLDRARMVTRVFFDKTGTLTLGELRLADPRAVAALPPAARSAVYQMTARSNHPKSRALFAAARALDAEPLDPGAAVVEEAGVGLTLRHPDGSWRLVAETEADDSGERALNLVRDGALVTRFGFRETLRHDVSEEIGRLARMGIETWLLSGDAEARVRSAAAELGIAPERARAGMTPAAKAALVAEHDAHDTLMVGDGINDALAFDAAHCAGTPAVDRPTLPARADFYLLTRGIGPVADAIALASHLRRTVVHNLSFAVLYNVGGIALALAGLVSPLVCAIAMPLSSLTVIALTMFSLAPGRSRAADPGPQPPPLVSAGATG